METNDKAISLGLYSSDCCSAELIFDTGDEFLRCPECACPCSWDLEEVLLSQDEFEKITGVAA
jgi:hypothetical protein